MRNERSDRAWSLDERRISLVPLPQAVVVAFGPGVQLVDRCSLSTGFQLVLAYTLLEYTLLHPSSSLFVSMANSSRQQPPDHTSDESAVFRNSLNRLGRE